MFKYSDQELKDRARRYRTVIQLFDRCYISGEEATFPEALKKLDLHTQYEPEKIPSLKSQQASILRAGLKNLTDLVATLETTLSISHDPSSAKIEEQCKGLLNLYLDILTCLHEIHRQNAQLTQQPQYNLSPWWNPLSAPTHDTEFSHMIQEAREWLQVEKSKATMGDEPILEAVPRNWTQLLNSQTETDSDPAQQICIDIESDTPSPDSDLPEKSQEEPQSGHSIEHDFEILSANEANEDLKTGWDRLFYYWQSLSVPPPASLVQSLASWTMAATPANTAMTPLEPIVTETALVFQPNPETPAKAKTEELTY